MLPSSIRAEGAVAVAKGIMQSVAPSDETGNAVLSPADQKARTLRFAINPALSDLPNDQLQLKAEIELALSAIQRLYPGEDGEAEFRPYFVQIAGAAQVGLVGEACYPEVGKQALAGIVADLIDQEGGDVKNKQLQALAVRSAKLSAPLLALYVLFRLLDSSTACAPLRWFMSTLLLNPQAVACFMVMLVGCFMGVTLSYAARTTVLSLKDLVTPDVERLRPYARLLVSAAWTLLVGYLIALDMIAIEIGGVSTKNFATQPMIAFVLGAVCGLSNLTLPGVVSKKVAESLPGK